MKRFLLPFPDDVRDRVKKYCLVNVGPGAEDLLEDDEQRASKSILELRWL